jgi:hypothetical protein
MQVPLFNEEPMAASWGDDLDDETQLAVLAIVAPYTLISAGLAIYNHKSIQSDTPGKVAGIFGTLIGATTVVGGGALIASGDEVLIVGGSGCAAVGAVSTYYGIKSLIAVRSKYFEQKNAGTRLGGSGPPETRFSDTARCVRAAEVSIAPALIAQKGGRYNIGLELRFSF